MNFLNNLLKIPIIKNTKYPAIKEWNKPQNQQQFININKFDVGIPTGINNNILVLDIDIKDDGIEEINKYFKDVFSDIRDSKKLIESQSIIVMLEIIEIFQKCKDGFPQPVKLQRGI